MTPRRGARGRTNLWFRIVGRALAVAVLFLPAMEAFALWDDKLTLLAEEKITHDDNLFRVSKGLDPVGDTYRTTSLGFNLDAPVSRQRFQAGYTWNATRYNEFNELNSDGHDARATWLWQLGNDASGQLGYTDTLALASFAFIQSRVPDPLRTRQAFFNAAYLVTPRWRLQAGAKGFDQANGDPQRQIFDVNIRSTDVSVSYVTPANTSVGVGALIEDGRFPNYAASVPGGPPPAAVDKNAYRQDGVAIVADWTPSGVSHLSARAARITRRYANAPEQNFDGNIARAQYDWKPTGKFSLAAAAQRDIYPYQDINYSFVLLKGVTLHPALILTEKIDVSGTLDYSIREFLPSPGQTSGTSPRRIDRVRSGIATVSYRPARVLTLLMSAQREGRSSNVVPADATATTPAVLPVDYVVNVFSIAARITF